MNSIIHNCRGARCPVHPVLYQVRDYVSQVMHDDLAGLTIGAKLVFQTLCMNALWTDNANRGHVIPRLDSQHGIAAELSVGRRTVQRALQELSEHNLIHYDYMSDDQKGNPKVLSMGPWYEEMDLQWKEDHLEATGQNGAFESAKMAPSTTVEKESCLLSGEDLRDVHDISNWIKVNLDSHTGIDSAVTKISRVMNEYHVSPDIISSAIAWWWEHTADRNDLWMPGIGKDQCIKWLMWKLPDIVRAYMTSEDTSE